MDYVEPFVTAEASHLRVGWALTEGYSPYPGGGEGWGGNGVGDDLYSYGFDGLHLWSGECLSMKKRAGMHKGSSDVPQDWSSGLMGFIWNSFPRSCCSPGGITQSASSGS